MKRMITMALFLTFSAAFATNDSNEVGGNGKHYYVDNQAITASDDNLGTVGKPWKTLERGVKTLKAGDRLTIKPGVYEGPVSLVNSGEEGKPIIIEGTKLGEVVVTGAKTIKNWRRSEVNPLIWEAEYNQKLRFQPPKGGRFSKFYVSSEPADLMMDGAPLFWRDKGADRPGTWHVDLKLKKIQVRLPDDSDPNARVMTVIGHSYGVMFKGDHYIVRNLVIRRFGNGCRVYGKKAIIENNIIEWCAYEGVKFLKWAVGGLLKDNVIRWHGMQGTTGLPGGDLIGNKLLFNNWKLNTPGWGAEGLKAWIDLGNSVDGNEAAYNGGLGLWLDGAHNYTLKNNLIHDNTSMGLEAEASVESTWENNVSYRNLVGFKNFSSSNTKVRNNILADNFVGVQYHFKRNRCPKLDAKLIKKRLDRYEKNHSKLVAYDWLTKHLDYSFPCSQVRDNITENNLLLNNRLNFMNSLPKQLPDPNEKELISGNVFKNNVLVNEKPDQMVAGFNSFAEYQKKTGDGAGCESFAKLDPSKFPEWAQKLYAKHQKLLSYPRSLMSAKNIRNELKVKNVWCRYDNNVSPPGLLAMARICESKSLKEMKFSDPDLKGYFIDLKGSKTLVLWRKHGRPADFAPVLLKSVPQDAVLESAWDEKIAFQRKNELLSINVGTWPIYLRGVNNEISELEPFKLKMPKKLVFGQPMEITLENPIGDGTLIFDKYEGVTSCPDELLVKGPESTFSLTLSEEAQGSFVEFRLAGNIGGLYAGRQVRIFTGEANEGAERVLKLKGFKPISLAKIVNCRLDGDVPEKSLMAMGESKSLKNFPRKLYFGHLSFITENGPENCVGLATVQSSEKRPEMVSVDLGGKKYEYIAFLQVCAWAPKKVGAPLLKYSLNYDDNLASYTFVRNGVNVADWWHAPDKTRQGIMKGNHTWKAWSGNCGSGNDVHAYIYVWKNPKPNAGVESLQISTMDPDKKVLMGVLAISALEKKKK